jgi:hypothetical protein
MWGSMGRVALGAAAVVAAAAGTALAANSGSFTDKAGDARPAPDISAVAVSSDDAGIVTVKVSVDRTELRPTDDVLVGIDTDQNPDTGTFFYGADVGLDLTGTQKTFLRPSANGDFTGATGSFDATSEDGVVTFTFRTSDLGVAEQLGFEVFVASFAPRGFDAAPDVRTVNYQLVPGAQRPALEPDRRAPVDEAVKATATHGKVARLSYFAADGRAETADTVRVYRGTKLLKTFRFRLEQTNPFLSYYATWKVPRTVMGKLRFCVQSTDRAGNRSNTSCAALTVK